MQFADMARKLVELDMPVFTTEDISNLTGKDPKYVKVYLHYLVKRKKIEKIERGKYSLPSTSPYVIASRITKNSYIALISAARFHNITAQIPNIIYVFSLSYHRPLKISGNYLIKFIKVGRSIFYGYGEYNRAYVSDLEKIFIDDAYYHGSLFYTEELETALQREIFDVKKFMKYFEMLKNKRARKRLHDAFSKQGIMEEGL